MPSDRYSIYLKEFEKKFVAINLKLDSRNREVGKRVDAIIRQRIALGYISKHELERQHRSLVAAFLVENEKKWQKEQGALKEWESERLQQLFPELNE